MPNVAQVLAVNATVRQAGNAKEPRWSIIFEGPNAAHAHQSPEAPSLESGPCAGERRMLTLGAR